MTQSILTHRLANGLTLVAEPMEWLESAAFVFLVSGGCSRDPADLAGLSNFTCEMVQRGCGPRDHRQFLEDLENLGVEHSAAVSNLHDSYGGAMPAEKLHEALAIYADLLQRPRLPSSQLEEGRMVCLQEVRAVEDDLAQRVMQQLRRRSYPDPFGRSPQGTESSIGRISIDDVHDQFAANYRPAGAILSVAGKVDWPRLRDRVEELLGSWQGEAPLDLEPSPTTEETAYIAHDSSQTHIGVSYPSVPYRDPNYFQARGAVGVLSGGMSSRLFSEIREQRSLCYSVFASMHSLRDRGSVFCYAGTSTDRAQETLDVLIHELTRLGEGIEEDELSRLKTQLRCSLILQQESSRSRAAAIAGDWYHLGRVRSRDEISQIIDGLTCDSINAYLAENPPRHFNLVTLGQTELEAPVGVS